MHCTVDTETHHEAVNVWPANFGGHLLVWQLGKPIGKTLHQADQNSYLMSHVISPVTNLPLSHQGQGRPE